MDVTKRFRFGVETWLAAHSKHDGYMAIMHRGSDAGAGWQAGSHIRSNEWLKIASPLERREVITGGGVQKAQAF
jgi:hypothetical protein